MLTFKYFCRWQPQVRGECKARKEVQSGTTSAVHAPNLVTLGNIQVVDCVDLSLTQCLLHCCRQIVNRAKFSALPIYFLLHAGMPHPSLAEASIDAQILGPFTFASNMFGFVLLVSYPSHWRPSVGIELGHWISITDVERFAATWHIAWNIYRSTLWCKTVDFAEVKMSLLQIAAVVGERELKLRQALRTMGLQDASYWLSWAAYEVTAKCIFQVWVISHAVGHVCPFLLACCGSSPASKFYEWEGYIKTQIGK